MQRLKVETFGQAGEQFAERARHQIERPRRRAHDKRVGVRRQEDYGDNGAGHAAERDLQNAIDCRTDGAGVRHLRQQQNDDGGDRRGGESGIDGGDESKRTDNNGEKREQRDFALMGNNDRNRAAVDRAAQRPDQIIERGFERSADAHLRHNHRSDNRP